MRVLAAILMLLGILWFADRLGLTIILLMVNWEYVGFGIVGFLIACAIGASYLWTRDFLRKALNNRRAIRR